VKRAIAAGVVLLVAGYIWLVLWADDRNQRFFMAKEADRAARNWSG